MKSYFFYVVAHVHEVKSKMRRLLHAYLTFFIDEQLNNSSRRLEAIDEIIST